jgi:hypothetical protein
LTRFFILLQVFHDNIPDILDEQTIKDTLTTTLAHHQQCLPNHLLLFKIGSISYRETFWESSLISLAAAAVQPLIYST